MKHVVHHLQIVERLLLRIPGQYFAIVLTKLFWSDLDLFQAYNNLDTGHKW